jgi:two-component system NtrC family response regulator
MPRILFIDDDEGGRKMATYNLRKAGFEVDESSNAEEGLQAFSADSHDLVITDVRMPGMSGIELATKIREQAPSIPVLVITAFGNVETAVQAMKAGAYDFVLKPFSRDQLQLVVERALQHRRLARENEELRRQLRGIERPITHTSSIMRETVAMIDRVAPTEASVLVTGESGTGKELAARRIHARSNRTDEAFVTVNCAGIPAELIEAELFGHEKGAFTGALRSRPGRFRQANGGTIFLDEIGELPASSQSKLLRVLQENVVDVLGADEPATVDVRVIAATNKDLRAEVEAGRFREDLFFRLNVVEIRVPPLRARVEDIPELAQAFVHEFSNGEHTEVPEELVSALKQRRWVGNVRELRNACERLVILSPSGELSTKALPPESSAGEKEPAWAAGQWLRLPPEGVSLLDIEKAVIEQALAHTGGNISQAARFLRIPRHILVYRIEKYGIERQRQQ